MATGDGRAAQQMGARSGGSGAGGGARGRSSDGGGAASNIFTTFGAVTVSGKNL